jgi:hypothetical protein
MPSPSWPSIRIAATSVGWAKAPTGPREARPDDRLRAEPTIFSNHIR